MVQFDRLRLSGFKSFVDPTELAIEPGMTGIVGHNGCGKSNLFEARKWVMGETSAKQMRGSEMEDVIFSGAGTRPARNRKSTRLNSSHGYISYAVFCLKKKKKQQNNNPHTQHTTKHNKPRT